MTYVGNVYIYIYIYNINKIHVFFPESPTEPHHHPHHDLLPKAIQEEALVRASMSAVQDLEKAGSGMRSILRLTLVGR